MVVNMPSEASWTFEFSTVFFFFLRKVEVHITRDILTLITYHTAY